MWMKDLRLAFRTLAKHPGYALVVVATLGLGIGAITAVSSLAGAVFFDRLPIENPDRLVVLRPNQEGREDEREQVSLIEYRDWREQARVFEDLGAFSLGRDLNLTGLDEPVRVRANLVSPSYFSVLGTEAAKGRTFTPEEAVRGGPAVTVLSHQLWQSLLGADPDVIGQAVELNDTAYTIVGIMPADFQDLAFENPVDLWLPATKIGELMHPMFLEAREARWLHAVGRLAPGVSLAQAQAEMDAIARRLAEDHPAQNEGYGIEVSSLSDYFFGHGQLARFLALLGAGAAFVLLIGGFNVTNLALVRAISRRRELAVRLSMGAGRRRLIQQFLVESLVLSVLGGLLGIFLGMMGTRVFLALSPLPFPGFVEVGINGWVLVVALLVTVLTGFACGVVPALRGTRVEVGEVLKEGGRSPGASGRASGLIRNALVVAQVAAAVTLLIGAGLTIRSFQEFQKTDVGFDVDNLLVVQTQLGPAEYGEDSARRGFYRSLLERLRNLPGVQAAGLWGAGLPGENPWYRELVPEGRSGDKPKDRVLTYEHRISPGSLSSLGIPLVAGRDFTSHDDEDAPRVGIVSEAMARAAWPGQDPVGKRYRRGGPLDRDPWITVVGVARNAKHRGRDPADADPKDHYLPIYQKTTDLVGVFVRTERDPSSLVSGVRRAVHDIDPNLPVFNIATMRERLAHEENEKRFYALLMGTFAVIALLLALLGIHGVLAYSIAQRTYELGVRIALGADRGSIVRLVGIQVGSLILSGIVLGLVVAFGVTRLMGSLVFGISISDPATFLSVPLALAVVGALASYVPLLRAMRVDPVIALKKE